MVVTKVQYWNDFKYNSEKIEKISWKSERSRQKTISSSFIVFLFVRLLYILFGKAENQRKYQKWAIIVIEEFDFRFHYMQSAIKVIRVKDKTRTFVPIVSSIIQN